MPQSLPVFGVARDARVKGVSHIDDEPEPLALASFEEAFNSPWKSDAHFVTYTPIGMGDGDPFPRINKPALGGIREAGYDLIRHTLAIDWDTPDHKPWGETATSHDFEMALFDAADKCPWVGDFACLYFTRSGARLVYVLDEPLPVEESEDRLRWMVRRLREAGFLCDELCDWTRLYRLPMVVRDGEHSEAAESFYIEHRPEARLKVSDLGTEVGKAGKADLYASVVPIDRPQPDDLDVQNLIERLNSSNGKWQKTEWYRKAKAKLKNYECADCLFNDVLMARPGSRDQTLHSYVGQACSMLYNLVGTTPEHIYALFVPAVQALGTDDDWSGKLWDKVCRCWALEEAKERHDRQQQEQQKEYEETARSHFVNGMRDWCDAEELFGEEDEAFEYASRKAIVSAGNTYFIAGKDGKYRSQQYTSAQLISAIRTHIDELIPTRKPSRDGIGYDDLPVQTIVNKHATVVDSVVGLPGIQGGYIESIDRPEAKLFVPCFSINPHLSPEYDRDVDEWLQQLFGDQIEDAKRWIAYSLAFQEGPICAMSIMGGQGVGKKLLVRGLAECLRNPVTAKEDDITGDYQYGLLKSPFLVVNEGWPRTKSAKHPADRFRELVSGDIVESKRKHRDPIEIRNPVRIILTANNFNVIRVLADKRDLSQEDREALSLRLMHFSVGDTASHWLRQMGGMKFTGAKGRRWVAPDAGGQSDYIVAKHFLWLYEQRKQWEPGRRLLVEGQGSSELMFELQTQTGSAPLVIEIILEMLKYSNIKPALDDLIIKDDGIYVVTSGVLEFWRQKMSNAARGSHLDVVSISQVLSGLWLRPTTNPYRIEGQTTNGGRRWIALDCEKLKKAADLHGFSSTKLDKIIANLEKGGKHEAGGTG